MMRFRFSYVLEVGTFSPKSPVYPTHIDSDTPENAAEIAKALYADNPFAIMGDRPLEATRIILTTSEPFEGFTFAFQTLERLN